LVQPELIEKLTVPWNQQHERILWLGAERLSPLKKENGGWQSSPETHESDCCPLFEKSPSKKWAGQDRTTLKAGREIKEEWVWIIERQ